MKKRILLAALSLLAAVCIGVGLAACANDGAERFTVTAVYDDSLGSVTLSPVSDGGKYDAGTSVTVTVVPAEGYGVSLFRVSGETQSLTDGKYTFVVNKNVQIDVAFAPEGEIPKERYTVTVVCDGEKGSVKLSPASDDGKYEAGTTVTAAVSAKAGYMLSALTVDGAAREADASGNFPFTVEKDLTVEATFKNAPTMSVDALASAAGKLALSGKGEERRIYDGYDDYGIEYQYSFVTRFDGDITAYRKRDDGMKLILTNRAYTDRDGKAVALERTLQNTITEIPTGESFDGYRNPFGTVLTAADLFLCGENEYVVKDAAKASEAAKAITGQSDEIESFTVTLDGDGAVFAVTIETKPDNKGEGITLNYSYYSYYSFLVEVEKDFDLTSWTRPYSYEEEHASLERALQAADEAESYRYHVKEDAEYNVYITKDAFYNDEEGFAYGYIEIDGMVYDIDVEDGVASVGSPAQFSDATGNATTYPSIAPIFADFLAFSPALFEPKGEGVFVLRDDDIKMAPAIAEAIYDSNDDAPMFFAQSVKITVQNDILYQVEIVTYLYAYETTFTFTYSGWDATELPVELKGSGDDDPVPSTYPSKFHGTFAGDGFNGERYVVTISADGIEVTVGGVKKTATEVHFEDEEFTFKLDGDDYSINANSDGDPISQIALFKGWQLFCSLDRQP